jgi:hypothetical protein
MCHEQGGLRVAGGIVAQTTRASTDAGWMAAFIFMTAECCFCPTFCNNSSRVKALLILFRLDRELSLQAVTAGQRYSNKRL